MKSKENKNQRPRRTAQEILDQTNELARELFSAQGYEAKADYKFYESRSARAILAWDMACAAQELLTQTDMENVLAELEIDDHVSLTP